MTAPAAMITRPASSRMRLTTCAASVANASNMHAPAKSSVHLIRRWIGPRQAASELLGIAHWGGIMEIDRRTMMAGAAAAIAAAPALARNAAGAGWYDRAIVIDALGGTGDPYMADGVTRMTDRGWAETVATGVTVVRDTVMPVGNLADPWGDYQEEMVGKQDLLGANPERLVLVRSADD